MWFEKLKLKYNTFDDCTKEKKKKKGDQQR